MTEIANKVWAGKLAIIFTLNPADSNDMLRRREHYAILPRNSYLPLYLPKLVAFFEEHLLVPSWSQRPEWWFEYDGVPVKWWFPIGLLFDTLTNLDPECRGIPVWHVTIHYRDYPTEHILPLNSGATLEQHWVNQVKESCYVMNGTAKPILSLSKQLSSDLWKSVEKHEFKLFWSVFPKLIPQHFKNVPVRFHMTVSNTVIDVPISPLKESTKVSVGDALKEVLPDIFEMGEIIAKPVLHGITIPLETPLVELYEQAVYIDGFLHFSIFMLA